MLIFIEYGTLIVASGVRGNQSYFPTEFIDLTDASKKYPTLPPFPYSTHGSAIGNFWDWNHEHDDTIIAGGIGLGEHSDEMYKIDIENGGQFIFESRLFYPRIYSATYNLEGILFSGGYPLGSNASKTMEFVNFDQHVNPGIGVIAIVECTSAVSRKCLSSPKTRYFLMQARIFLLVRKTSK